MTVDFQKILPQLKLTGEVAEVKPLGNGLINDTYRVKTASADTPDYVLQRINNAIFTNVDLLQHNIEVVTRHIRKKLEARGEEDIDRKVLTFVETNDGKTFFRDDEDRYWRMMVFIPGAQTFETVNPEYSYLAGVKDILDLFERDAERMCQGERLFREGKLPRRICHCDTKVNNMMFDAETGKFLLVIDLDTVMPSLFFSDYGDFLRSAANTTAEDDPNLDNVGFNEELFKAFTKGYVESAGEFLTPLEIELLPYAVELFPFMQSVRFMWDYLSGDHYWKCNYPEHNLDRAKNQLRLYQEACKREPMMKEFIESLKK